ncbi:hypothetical protein [Streptomyces azureus]|uniref:hypothetical protein n=1 Tax=Streptomyces azureus TaxID=146537 RepID=UPI0007508376|nr:hypothetical protein [Streptomyces azureus]
MVFGLPQRVVGAGDGRSRVEFADSAVSGGTSLVGVGPVGAVRDLTNRRSQQHRGGNGRSGEGG